MPYQPDPFFKNLRDEMARFHYGLPKGQAIKVFVSCGDGNERLVDTVQPAPPNMLVFECRDGNTIVQHINCVQLRFAACGAESEAEIPRSFPFGFRLPEDENQTS